VRIRAAYPGTRLPIQTKYKNLFGSWVNQIFEKCKNVGFMGIRTRILRNREAGLQENMCTDLLVNLLRPQWNPRRSKNKGFFGSRVDVWDPYLYAWAHARPLSPFEHPIGKSLFFLFGKIRGFSFNRWIVFS
jgi:hypothetical protein